MSIARDLLVAIGPRLRAFAANVAVLCLLSTPTWAAPTFPSAGRVGLEPPPGMSVSKRFSGFENSTHTASILIAEMPGIAFSKLQDGFTDAALAQRGFVVTGRKDSVLAGAKSFLAIGTQKGMGITFNKWVLVAGNDDVTAVVTVQIPTTESAAFPAAAIDAALRSVEFGKAKSLDEKIAALPYRVNDLAGFRVSGVLGGSGLMLTMGPKDIIVGAEQPMVIVASSFGPLPAADKREEFATRALKTLSNIEDVEIEDSAFYKKGDNQWHRIHARAVDSKSDVAIHVVQLIHFLPNGWIRTVGIVRPEDAGTLGKKVEKVFESVVER